MDVQVVRSKEPQPFEFLVSFQVTYQSGVSGFGDMVFSSNTREPLGESVKDIRRVILDDYPEVKSVVILAISYLGHNPQAQGTLTQTT